MANIRSNINLLCCEFGLATFPCFFQFHFKVKTLIKQPEQQAYEILVSAVGTDFLAFSMFSTLRQRLPFPSSGIRIWCLMFPVELLPQTLKKHPVAILVKDHTIQI
jgi:hypothetical protein